VGLIEEATKQRRGEPSESNSLPCEVSEDAKAASASDLVESVSGCEPSAMAEVVESDIDSLSFSVVEDEPFVEAAYVSFSNERECE